MIRHLTILAFSLAVLPLAAQESADLDRQIAAIHQLYTDTLEVGVQS